MGFYWLLVILGLTSCYAEQTMTKEYVDDDAVRQEFERRKWALERDIDFANKKIEEEQAKPASVRLQPPSLLEKWVQYLATIKETLANAAFPDALPPKIDRVSQLHKDMMDHWPVGNELSDVLLSVEESWGIFR